MASQLIRNGIPMDFECIPNGFPIGLNGPPLEFEWIPNAFPIGFEWTPWDFGFPRDLKWIRMDSEMLLNRLPMDLEGDSTGF